MENAKALLISGGYTCVLQKGERVYTSCRRGVAPLLAHLDAGTDLQGFSAADKVVGKAAAFLYCLLGVKEVWAGVISQPAMEVLRAKGILVQYESLVSAIVNRTGDGFCPMETATLHISDPEEAVQAVRNTLQKLQQA